MLLENAGRLSESWLLNFKLVVAKCTLPKYTVHYIARLTFTLCHDILQQFADTSSSNVKGAVIKKQN